MRRKLKHFNSALAVARAQQAKFWELRAAMSMTRLWRESRGKLANCSPTEGFDTLDAKALLDDLHA